MTEPRIYVVADEPEAERIGRWLSEDLGGEIRWGAASDETLADVLVRPPRVVVLTAGLVSGDALSFAGALRGAPGDGEDVSLVLIAEENGRVRNALDAMPFRADRFLRRPLSRSALGFAVRSYLNLGRAGVVGTVDPPPPERPLADAISALGLIHAAPLPASADISSGVALHTLDARLDQATSEAIEAFLLDAVDAVLSEQPLADDDGVVDEPAARPAAPAAVPPSEPPRLREPTMVLASGGRPVAEPQVPDEQRTGTFVSALRRHMSAVEARLFGEPARLTAVPDEEGTAEIDLDAIGVTAVTAMAHDEPPPEPATDLDPPPAVSHAGGRAESQPAASGWPGDLVDEDVASLLGRLAREAVTARVVFRRAETRKTVWLEDGRPVFAASEAPDDRMAEMLLREGKIGREPMARAREALVASGRRLGEILVEHGGLKRRELYPVVRRHVEDLLYSLFAWESGSYTITPGAGAREEKIRLAAPAAALIYEGIRRKLGLERLRELVGPPHAVLSPRRRDDLAQALADADLAPEDRQLVPLFDGRRSLADIAAEGGGNELAVYQLAHLLRALDLATCDAGSRDGPVVARGATTGVGGATAGTSDAGIDRERVRSKYAQVLEADYFELLGVRRDVTAFEVRRAYEAARRDYAPESFAAEVQRELAAELAAIAQVLGEAHAVLRDDAVRAAYRDGLVDAPALEQRMERG